MITSKKLLSARSVFILILLSMLPSWGQITTRLSSSLTIDFCRFKGDDNQTNLEIYISLPRDEVSMKPDSFEWYGALIFDSKIRRDNESVATDSWIIDFIDDNEPIVSATQKVIDARIYQLPTGFYDITISTHDSVSGKAWTIHDTITIFDRPIDKLTISDIELASHLLPIHVRPIFSRGDFSLVPNPENTFGGSQSFFIYYVEIYPPVSHDINPVDSLSTIISPSDMEFSCTIQRSIINGIQDTIRVFEDKIKSGSIHGIADLDSIDLSEIPTGTYQFNINITDKNGNTASENKKFYIYDKNLPPEDFKPAINIIEVDMELAEINFLLTLGQRKLVRRMKPEEKQHFLTQFWRRYDDDLETPEVPTRIAFRKRVKLADERFDTSRSAGHKTDRGRIFILYGEPSEKEYHPLEIDSKPYEVWTYDHIDGGVYFAFVDRSGLGEASLVHSSKNGETFNPRWQELFVFRTGAGSRR